MLLTMMRVLVPALLRHPRQSIEPLSVTRSTLDVMEEEVDKRFPKFQWRRSFPPELGLITDDVANNQPDARSALPENDAGCDNREIQDLGDESGEEGD